MESRSSESKDSSGSTRFRTPEVSTAGMLCIHSPDWTSGNPYQDRLRDALEAEGMKVVFADFPAGPLPVNRLIGKHPGARLIHLHWIRDLIAPIVWASTPWRRQLRIALLILDLLLARARGVAVVWTIHNLVSHESQNPANEIHARSALARFVDHMIVHSASAQLLIERTYELRGSGKFTVIRHGNYAGCYEDDPSRAAELRRAFSGSGDEVVLLLLGALRPYKGVERLIDIMKRLPGECRVKLVITGKPLSAQYGNLLKLQAEGSSNIVLQPDFVPDSEISPLHAAADAVVIPFERTLTSGSALLAMTQGKALILPEEARVLDLGDDGGAYFFESDEQLLEILQSLDAETLRKMGEKNLEAANEFTWKSVGKSTAEVYRAAIGAKRRRRED